MKNIKIILIGLVLLFSGCVETVEIPTPIPTSHALTEISDLSINYGIFCYDEYMNITLIENKVTDYVVGVKETTNVINYDGYSVVEVLIIPDTLNVVYIPSNIIYDSSVKCRINSVDINYHIRRTINNNIVIDESDSETIYYRYNYDCIKVDMGYYTTLDGDFIYEKSMHGCLKEVFYELVMYETFYPRILDKYR